MRAEKQYLIDEVSSGTSRSPTTSSSPTSRRTHRRGCRRAAQAPRPREGRVPCREEQLLPRRRQGAWVCPSSSPSLIGPTAVVVGGKNSAGVAKIAQEVHRGKAEARDQGGRPGQEADHDGRRSREDRGPPAVRRAALACSSGCSPSSNGAAFVRVLDAKVKKEQPAAPAA